MIVKRTVLLSVIVLIISCSKQEAVVERFENGNISQIGQIQGGLKEGVWYKFSWEGDTSYIREYHLGKLIHEESLSTGGQRIEQQMKNGKKHGIMKHYDSLGNLDLQNEWSDDKPVGTSLAYYPSGVLKNVSFYNDSNEIYKSYNFYQNGLMDNYISDPYNGVFYDYDSLGNLKVIATIDNGRLVDTLVYNP